MGDRERENDPNKQVVDVETRLLGEQSPVSTINRKEQWNNPRINMFKLSAAFFGFFMLGLKDSMLGVIIPQLEKDYNLHHTQVSIVFVMPVVGFFLATLVNDPLHRLAGRRGVAIISTIFQLLFFIIAASRPPSFKWFVIGYLFGGFGQGFIEGSWNTMCAGFDSSNEIMGVLHSFFGFGGVIGPTIAQAMLAQGFQWNQTYMVAAGLGAFSLCWCTICFRKDTAEKYRRDVVQDNNNNKSNKYQETSVAAVVKERIIVVMAIMLLLYIGSEVCLGGWVTTFMIEVRHGDPDKMGYVSTGFWVGMVIGRALFGLFGSRFAKLENLVTFYIISAIFFTTVYAAIPSVIISSISVAMAGLVAGPLYPTIMTIALQKLPRKLHVSGIGFSATVAIAGAAVWPFIAGVLADKVGTWVIAPIIVFCLTGVLAFWYVVCKYC